MLMVDLREGVLMNSAATLHLELSIQTQAAQLLACAETRRRAHASIFG